MSVARPDSPETLEDIKIMGVLSKIANSSNPFGMSYKAAYDYELALSRGDTNLEIFDFSVMSQCILCGKPASKMLVCGRCGGATYCSKACQVRDWKTPRSPNAPIHKNLCPQNAIHMKRKKELIDRTRMFPFLKIEKDETTNHDIALARMYLLGATAEFGYWARPGGVTTSDILRAKLAPKNPYEHGNMLLESEWKSHTKMWRIRKDWIPQLDFSRYPKKAPELPSGKVKDWKSWYEWRGLPLDSPACLLMDTPLSVYFVLTDVLKIIDPNNFNGRRRTLNVHLVGVETEFNLIPLYSELALLCPNTHIILTIFSTATPRIIAAAKSNPKALIHRNSGNPDGDDVVWSYLAPEQTGGGSIDIKIAERGVWDEKSVLEHPEVDAIVGTNAGLNSYPEWGMVMLYSLVVGIPMGVTEYAEQSLEIAKTTRPIVFGRAKGFIASSFPSAEEDPVVESRLKYTEYTFGKEEIKVNPWMRPGQRPVGQTRLPNFYNGFGLAFYDGPKGSFLDFM